MSNAAHPREPQQPAPRGGSRSVALPGAAKQKDKGGVRGGLLLLGLLLVVVSGGAFWYVLRGVDERQEYLVAARTLQRWDIVGPGDLTVVEANLGDAAGVPPQFANVFFGQWSTGTVPAGTIVTPGMFSSVPLSSGEEAGMVLMEVNLPADQAPGGTLAPGDRIALFGAESSEDIGEPTVALIGVLELDLVSGGTLTYLVTPADAVAITDVVDRFNAASDRRIWKLGVDLSSAQLAELYSGAGAPGASDAFVGEGP
ncbi:MAG: SAF domain-containing protein [bacterium]|nr:SAF domain-containing protein [bacterium]